MYVKVARHLCTALVKNGFLTLGHFRKNPCKVRYGWLLVPIGIRENLLLAHYFMEMNYEKLIRAALILMVGNKRRISPVLLRRTRID
jgi:hypothetical protein